MKNLLSPKKYFVKQLFSNFFSKKVAFTKFLSKMCDSKFPKLPLCAVWLDKLYQNLVFDRFQSGKWYKSTFTKRILYNVSLVLRNLKTFMSKWKA